MINKIRQQPLFWLMIIVMFGSLIRLVGLETTPPVNRDELAIGYNAYSVLKTGFDEHGAGPYPIHFRSFGDYKLPGLVYSAVPFIAFFGNTITAIRLPTVLLGISLIPLTYFFASAFFNSPSIGLIAAFLLSVSPWHVHGSRSAYEPIAALSFTILAIYSLWKVKKTLPAIVIFILLAFISNLFYHQLLITLIPVFLIVWFFLRYDKQRFDAKYLILGMGLCIVILISVSLLFGNVNNSRLKTTIFNFQDTNIAQLLSIERYYLNEGRIPLPITKLLTNELYISSHHFIRSYLTAFDFDFLFSSGGNNVWHNVKAIRFGNLYLHDLFLIGIGLATLITQRRKIPQRTNFILAWFFSSPLTHAVTKDTPNINRLIDYHYVLVLIGSMGFYTLWCNIHNRTIGKLLVLVVISVGIIQFAVFYHLVLSGLDTTAYNAALPQLAKEIQHKAQNYEQVFIDDQEMAYIYFSYFIPFDPTEIQISAIWEENGLEKITVFDNYEFQLKDRQKKMVNTYIQQMEPKKQKGSLVVLKASENDSVTEAVFVVRDDLGRPLWKAFEIPYLESELELEKLQTRVEVLKQ
jgi:4-amino-4-deoxy-L-arabinose transferase-like glycosyltransferase